MSLLFDVSILTYICSDSEARSAQTILFFKFQLAKLELLYK
jgi:hypothetical protein